ncbi:MAG: SGNH/GDSL hydrolase family protein [Patescibacteria group bacterium]
MGFNKWWFIILIAVFFVLLTLIFYSKTQKKVTTNSLQTIEEKGRVKVKYPQDYTLVLVGDSMTEYLGNSDELRAYLKEYYPDKTFEVLNYGFGSTNILSVEQRLTQKTFYAREFRPILDIAFDLILIESFGNNPLSDYPLKEGLKKQAEALDRIVELVRKENPKAKILFLATISPNSKTYAYRKVDLTDEERKKWTDERVAYIRNHIEYAKAHNIPLVNVFEASLDKSGDGNRDYISDTDYIHPSPTGVIFISKQIADFIFEQKIL